MQLNPLVKKNWEQIQQQHEVPVNAIGVPINSKDVEMLRVWHDNGIDRFIRR